MSGTKKSAPARVPRAKAAASLAAAATPLVAPGVPPVVFLDANILIPEYLRSIFLELSEAGILQANWSEGVLTETRCNLIDPENPRRAAVTDEAFFNRRNLFVMDARGRSDTDELGLLTFSGYRQTPMPFGEHIRDVWQAAPVGLHQVTFPPDHGRPYFFDYDDERRRIESAKIASWRRLQEQAWAIGIQDYLAAAMAYYDSDHAAAEEGILLAIVETMYDNPAWHRGFETLRDKHFYGYHCVLPVLLSIQHARSVGYSKQLSAYQVIEAGLRSSGNHIHKHAFAILYLWAYKAYQPAVNEKQQRWLRDYAHTDQELSR